MIRSMVVLGCCLAVGGVRAEGQAKVNPRDARIAEVISLPAIGQDAGAGFGGAAMGAWVDRWILGIE